jgi:hypothetical protein
VLQTTATILANGLVPHMRICPPTVLVNACMPAHEKTHGTSCHSLACTADLGAARVAHHLRRIFRSARCGGRHRILIHARPGVWRA